MTDTVEVTCDVFIEAKPETVFAFLTEQEKAVQWFGQITEIDGREGGRFHVAAESGVHATGEFKEVIPYEKVVFTWGGMHGIPEGDTTVEVILSPKENGTQLTLRHYNISVKESADDFKQGWVQHAFPLLKLVSEGGSTEERCFRSGSDCDSKESAA